MWVLDGDIVGNIGINICARGPAIDIDTDIGTGLDLDLDLASGPL